MTNEDNSRNPAQAFAELASATQRLFQQSWKTLGAEGLAQAIHASTEGEGGWDTLLNTLQAQVDLLFQQLHQQTAGIELPIEQILGFYGQLSRAQECAGHAVDETLFPWSLEALRQFNPKLGLLQQRQQRLDDAAQALSALQAAQRRYVSLLQQVADRALAGFRQEIEQRPQRKAALREIYDIWLSSSEAAYERVLYSDEYAESFGNLVNSAAMVVKQIQLELDDTLKVFNLPTRQEMTSTQRRLYELRRGQRLTPPASQDDLDALRREMAEMRTEIQQLRKHKASTSRRRQTSPAARDEHGD